MSRGIHTKPNNKRQDPLCGTFCRSMGRCASTEKRASRSSVQG